MSLHSRGARTALATQIVFGSLLAACSSSTSSPFRANENGGRTFGDASAGGTASTARANGAGGSATNGAGGSTSSAGGSANGAAGANGAGGSALNGAGENSHAGAATSSDG